MYNDYKTPADRLHRAMRTQRIVVNISYFIVGLALAVILAEISGLVDNFISWIG